MSKIKFKEEGYNIIGACMEVHGILGRGHKEIIYNDALEIEFGLRNIPFEREKRLPVVYKNQTLPHHSITDFLLYNKIILETKALGQTTKADIGQVLNQLASAELELGILVNFGESQLYYKRIVL